MENSNIRELVALMDHELSASASLNVTEEGKASVIPLKETWKRLVDALALPAEPTRVCPKCGKLGMQQATLCGYCWTRLAAVRTGD